MKTDIGKSLTASLVLVCILTFASLPQTIATPQTAEVYLKVTPQVVGAATTGEPVVVDITINDLRAKDKLVAMEWKLKFDPALLEISDCTEGNFLKSEAENATEVTGKEYSTYFYCDQDTGIDFILSFTLYYEYPWPPEVFPGDFSNGGTLATITFNATSIPEEVTEMDLTIFDVTLLDVDGNEILYDHLEHGKYIVPAHKAEVYLKVTPQVVGAATTGEPVVVDITINEVRAEDRLVAMEWKLKFDPALLEISDCTEGNFLKSEAERAAAETGDNYGAESGCVHDPGTNFVLSWALYHKHPWPPEVFPDGSGTLARITFNAILIPEEVTEVDLYIFDVTMLDVNGNGIVYDHKEHGKYVVPTAAEDVNIDGRVNIQDLFIFGKSFGSYPGHPRWDVRADVNVDGKVGILDGLKIAKQFGKITSPKLFLKVEPEYSHVSVGEEFSINITINDVEGTLNIVGVEWKLKFDTNILEVLDVVEGDFLKSVADKAGPDHGTCFWWLQEDNYVISFTLLYRDPWPPKMFPEGSGTLATIKFRVIAEGISVLELDDVALEPPVRYHHLEDGIAIVQ